MKIYLSYLKWREYLVASAAALAVLEQGLVPARRHGHVGVLVGVLEPARAACRHDTSDTHTMGRRKSNKQVSCIPLSSGPAPLGAPYQVALAGSQPPPEPRSCRTAEEVWFAGCARAPCAASTARRSPTTTRAAAIDLSFVIKLLLLLCTYVLAVCVVVLR